MPVIITSLENTYIFTTFLAFIARNNNGKIKIKQPNYVQATLCSWVPLLPCPAISQEHLGPRSTDTCSEFIGEQKSRATSSQWELHSRFGSRRALPVLGVLVDVFHRALAALVEGRF